VIHHAYWNGNRGTVKAAGLGENSPLHPQRSASSCRRASAVLLLQVTGILVGGIHQAMLDFSIKYGPVCRWD